MDNLRNMDEVKKHVEQWERAEKFEWRRLKDSIRNGYGVFNTDCSSYLKLITKLYKLGYNFTVEFSSCATVQIMIDLKSSNKIKPRISIGRFIKKYIGLFLKWINRKTRNLIKKYKL